MSFFGCSEVQGLKEAAVIVSVRLWISGFIASRASDITAHGSILFCGHMRVSGLGELQLFGRVKVLPQPQKYVE